MYNSKEVLDFLIKDFLENDPLFFPVLQWGRIKRPISPFIHQAILISKARLLQPIRILVGDEVGLGKTIEAISLLKIIEKREERPHYFLIIVPRILVRQWEEELKRMGIDAHRIHRIDRRMVMYGKLDNPSEGYYIGSIDLLKKQHGRDVKLDYKNKILGIDWNAIVVDEVHNVTYYHKETQRYELVKELASKPDRHVILLSATPHRGDNRDFNARLILLFPELKNPENKKFRKILESLIDKSFYLSTHDTIFFRRTKNLVNKMEDAEIFKNAELSAILVEANEYERTLENEFLKFSQLLINRMGELDPERPTPAGLLLSIIMKRLSSSIRAGRLTIERIIKNYDKRKTSKEKINERELLRYQEILFPIEYIDEEEIDIKLDSIASKLFNILLIKKEEIDVLEKIRKKAVEIEKTGESKFLGLKNLLEKELEKGNKVIIFTEYKDTLEYLYKNLAEILSKKGYNIACITGGQKLEYCKTISEIEQEIEKENIDVLIATDVASEGLNLQFANILINYDIPWTPLKIEQRIGRIWRLGQDKNVHIYTLFRGVRSEREILEKLFMKILNISQSTGTEKSLIGEKTIIHETGKGRFISIEDLWRTKYIDETVGREINDYKIITSYITGKLDKLSRELLVLINRAKEEIEKYNIYPKIKPARISEKKYIGYRSSEMIKQLANNLNVIYSSIPRTINRRDQAAKEIVNIYTNLKSKYYVKPKNLFILSPVIDSNKEIYIGKLVFKINNNVLASQIFGIEKTIDGKTRELFGEELLNILIKLRQEKSSVTYGQFISNIEIKLKNSSREKLGVLEYMIKNRDLRDKIRSLTGIKLSQGIPNIIIELDYVVGIKHTDTSLSSLDKEDFVKKLLAKTKKISISPDTKKSVQELSEELVFKLCKQNIENEEVYCYHISKDIPSNPYDIVVRRRKDNSTKYLIEVKGHIWEAKYSILGPNELIVAEDKPDEYIICVVFLKDDENDYKIKCKTYREYREENKVQLESIIDREKNAKRAKLFHF